MTSVPSVGATTAAVEPKSTKANVPAPPATTFRDELAAQAERLQHVKGHHFAKVIGGERDGMYVNRSDNARAGQAFEIVRRDGRTFHVYGEGRDRAVVEVRRPERPETPAAPDTSRAGGAAAP